jgi:hypothetical protein
VSEDTKELAQEPGTLEHALWWARRMGHDVERARIRWLEIERRRAELVPLWGLGPKGTS